jgi:hypothetical protein
MHQNQVKQAIQRTLSCHWDKMQGSRSRNLGAIALFLEDHQKSGEQSPGSLIVGNLRNGVAHECVTQWLRQQEVIFDETDLKHYGDGSFRLYFRVNSFLEGEYFRLVNTLMEKVASSTLGSEEKF